MAKFENLTTGDTFEVDDDRASLFARWPGKYRPVDVYPCEECGETFDSPQKLGGHTRSHSGE